MTSDDFEKWRGVHRALFPGIRTWLGGFSDDEAQEIVDMWQNQLSGLTLDEALGASQAMYDAETQPRGYGSHPAWIKRHVKDQRCSGIREIKPRQKTSCLDCSDTGWVSVFVIGEVLARHVQLHGTKLAMTASTTVHCDCGYGRSFGGLLLDRSTMTLTPRCSGHSLPSLAEFFPEIVERRRVEVQAAIDFLDGATNGQDQ